MCSAWSAQLAYVYLFHGVLHCNTGVRHRLHKGIEVAHHHPEEEKTVNEEHDGDHQNLEFSQTLWKMFGQCSIMWGAVHKDPHAQFSLIKSVHGSFLKVVCSQKANEIQLFQVL